MFFSGNGKTYRMIRPESFVFEAHISNMKQDGYNVISHQFKNVHLAPDDIFTSLHKKVGEVENIIDI